jgi:hypothetical protein
MNRTSIVVLMILLVTTPAWAQVGGVNPNVPVAITVPPPAGSPLGTPPTTRASTPFTNEPNQQNNPFPMLLNAGVSGTGGYGVPIRHIYMPPQAVQIVVYVREQEVTGDQWVTQYTELPGYYVTETTLGYLYPDRWALYSPAKGVYQWQRVPAVFQSK